MPLVQAALDEIDRSTDAPPAPRVWLLMGQKAGDNNQVLALAEGTGWAYEIKQFVHQPYELVTNLALGSTLSGVVKSKSSRLAPPWPDLVISAGRRNEPISRWIRDRAAAEGHRVRTVHVGRPWSNLGHFDLVITTPQYRLPQRPNVLHNKTPLHRVTAERLASDAEAWRGRLAHLPQPFIAVVIGGSSGPYSFDHAAAARLAREASDLASSLGGSLLITTSARTPVATVDTLCETLSAPAYLYRWSKGAKDNPYFAFLGLAQAIIVTGDSMSMLTEACATGKPVYIFDLGEGEWAMRPQPRGSAPASAVPVRRRFEGARVRAFLYRQMMKFGPRRLSRDIRIIHSYLVENGHAAWLGDSFPDIRPNRGLDCLQRAVARVRALCDFTPTAASTGPTRGPLSVLMPARRSA